MYFSMIELKSIVCYITIKLTHYKIRVYYFFIFFRIEIFFLIHNHIQATSALYSYSIISIFASIFVLKVWKWIWEGYYPICIWSVSTPIWGHVPNGGEEYNNLLLVVLTRCCLRVDAHVKTVFITTIHRGICALQQCYWQVRVAT
jgi:hypothetical protein